MTRLHTGRILKDLENGKSDQNRVPRKPTIAERLILLSVVFVPLQQAFTIDIGFPLKPSELLIIMAIAVLPFQRLPQHRLRADGIMLWSLIAVVILSSLYRLLASEPIGFIPGFTRSANVDLVLYLCYAILVALFYSVGRGISREQLGRAIVLSTWVMGAGVLIQLALGNLGHVDVLELLNFETKAKGLALDDELDGGVMRSGSFVEGQHLGFYAAGCVLVALSYRKYFSAIIAILCLIYSQSTTGFISLVVGAVVVVMIRPSVSLAWKFISAGIAAFITYSTSAGLRTLINYQLAKLGVGSSASDFSGSNISMDLREVKTLIGFEILGENPLLGVGPGRYGVHFFDHTEGYEIPDYYFTLDSHRAIAENTYAQIGAELGLLGLFAWILLLLAVRPKILGADLPNIALWLALVIGVGTQSNWTFLPIWTLILYLSVARREAGAKGIAMDDENTSDSDKKTRSISNKVSEIRRKAYRAS